MILNLRSIVVGTFALSLLPWPAFAAAAGAPPPRTLERPVQLAQGHMRSGERMERHEGRDEHGRRDEHGDRRGGHPGESRSGEYRYWHGDRVLVVPPARRRVYRHVIVVRPHGHWYPGYGHFYMDAEAYKWLAFTAITLKILDLLNEAQERAHEEAQIKATTAPVGETITWNQGNASGSVVATRDGTSSLGRYCREFQQTVTIGGRTESAYGTACRQADGTWEVVSTR
jgi:hypothetical protein